MTNFNRIKKMLNGSTTMPQGTAMGGGHIHAADGSCCGHDHSHDIGPEHSQDHSDHKHHKDGSCCDHGDDCDK